MSEAAPPPPRGKDPKDCWRTGKLHQAVQAQAPRQDQPDEPTLHVGGVECTPGGFADRVCAGTIEGLDAFDGARAAVARHIDRYYREFYFLETADWAAEWEYRVLLTSADAERYALIDYRDALVAAVVGFRFPDYQLPGARALCDARGIAFRRIEWKSGDPSR